LLAALHARVPGTSQRPLFEPASSDRLGPFEIGGNSTRLVVQDVAALTSHPRLLLTIATFGTVPRVRDAELSFAGTACAYRTASGVELADNYFVAFDRTAGCVPSGATGEATLTFRLENRARIALVVYVGRTPPPRDALVLASPGLAEARLSPILQGDVVDVSAGSDATRGELLSYMWNAGLGNRWLDAAIGIGGVLVGCAVLIGWPLEGGRRFDAARSAVAAFLAAFALSASYAVLCPPFQLADEPSHFLVLAEYIGRPGLDRPAEQWARRAMFEEIRFHPYRAFSPLDRGRSGRAWSEISTPSRDLFGAVRFMWRPLAAVGRHMDLPQLLLTARLFHAAGFALAAALFVLLVRRGTGSAASLSAALPLCLVPALPQFGMHVSNYAPLLHAYIVLAAGIVVASWDGPRSWTAGPILGVGLGAAMTISRSSLPLLPLVACVLVARALLGDRAARGTAAWAFWSGFTLGLAGMLFFIHASYADELDMYGGLVAPTATAFTVLLRHPLLAVPFGAAGLMSELLITRRRCAVAYRPAPAVVRGIALGAAIGLFAIFAASLLVPYPRLPLYVMPHRPSAAVYVRQALLACATFLRFGRPDWLTSVTFFAGFGWLDTIPPVRLVSTVAGASGAMLVLLLLWVAWARSTRTLIWLALGAAGFLASIAAYALSIIRAVPSDLHGRYLIGVYLCALVVCWTGLGRAADIPSADRRRDMWLAAAACAFVLAVNVYSLRLILARYFS